MRLIHPASDGRRAHLIYRQNGRCGIGREHLEPAAVHLAEPVDVGRTGSLGSGRALNERSQCATVKHMVEVGIRALKQNASAVVAQAAAGQTITITDRGLPVARLSAIPASPLEEMRRSGRIRPARRSLRELPPPETGPPVSLELAAMRESERY